jgi:hypothetical protein
MASSSKGEEKKSLGPRFHDYLNGLREEFELQSPRRPSRFNIYLRGLKDEFDLMIEEVESLKKERDEYKAIGIFPTTF